MSDRRPTEEGLQKGLELLEKGGLTVVIPVYNEAAVIEKTVRELNEVILQNVKHSSLIIIEDGSTDGTHEILGRLQSEIPFVWLTQPSRRSFSGALKMALSTPKTEFIFFCDSDGQYDPRDFFLLVKALSHYDFVSGRKQLRRDPRYRIVLSRGLNGLVRFLFGFPVHDIDSSFKLMRRSVIDSVLGDMNFEMACPMIEFAVRALQKGFSWKEVFIHHRPRKDGVSRVFHGFRLPVKILKISCDLLKMRLKNKHLKGTS